LHSPIWRRFTHSGSDVMYLSTLSVYVTATKCDCNFSVKIKSTEFLNKIQWAFLKFDKIDEFKKN